MTENATSGKPTLVVRPPAKSGPDNELAKLLENRKLVLRLVMPSTGDMELMAQNGGTIDLQPIFYGDESMGPHIQVLSMELDGEGKSKSPPIIMSRYRLKLRGDGRLEVKKGT